VKKYKKEYNIIIIGESLSKEDFMKLFTEKANNLEFLNSNNQAFVDVGKTFDIDYGSFFHPTLETLAKKINSYFFKKSKDKTKLFFKKTRINEQAYILEVKKKKINIYASSKVGIYYGLLSLEELTKKYKGSIPELVLRDEPDLKVRGFMLDISRSKVPKRETIYKLIDLLSMYRYNHLELYVEGFSFEYKSMPHVNEDGNYLSVDDYVLIEHYANEHFIDLVPNQNGFGHMTEWLKKEEYKDLAMVDGLFEIWGSKRVSSTINPLDERSANLVTMMYKDMLSKSSSPYFNMNFDEPYELGFGKTAEASKKIGNEAIFVEYFNKMASVVKQYGKIPLLWADAIINHPNGIKNLDKDAILIDWGYNDDYPFYEHSTLLNKLKRPYLLACGTSTWSVGTSKFTEMLFSTMNAISTAIQNDALGVILTDWGDFGHLQYPIYAYPGIIYAGLAMWKYHGMNYHTIREELNSLVGVSEASLILDISKYNLQEDFYKSYSTKLFNPIIQAELCKTENVPIEAFTRRVKNLLLDKNELLFTKEYISFLNKKLDTLNDSYIKEQLTSSILLLNTLCDVQDYLLDPTEERLDEIFSKFDQYLVIHKILWIEENKEEGFEFSKSRIDNLKLSLSDYLNKQKEAQL